MADYEELKLWDSVTPHSHYADRRQTHGRGLVVDNFAGGGGASTGIEMATGRSPDIAINHDPDAIAMHKANHPDSKHYCEDVWQVDPEEACGGHPVDIAWFSPDCKHFSRAKGGKPVDKNIRGLAWVAIKWAYFVRPRVIFLENVAEIQTWGPLDKDNRPIKDRMGETFDGFIGALTRGIDRLHPAFAEMCNALDISTDSDMAIELSQGLGYEVDYRLLKSCDYGAPTTRTRFYKIARSDGEPIDFPEGDYADAHSEAVMKGEKKPYHTAAECIDWSVPTQSIFDRKKPLAENTMKRIARGLKKFVIDNPDPFIVPCEEYISTPYVTPIGYGEAEGQAPRVNSVEEPLGTVVTSGKHYLTAPILTQYHTETHADEVRGQLVTEPLLTQDTSNRFGLAAAYILTMRHNMDGQKIDEPLSTVSCSGAHHAEVKAFLLKYYGAEMDGQKIDEPLHTVTAKDRFALVTIHGEQYVIVDVRMRMLQPRELFNAQGFPKDYVIDHDYTGKEYSRAKQVARCGNAVTPPVPAALVRANLPDLCVA